MESKSLVAHTSLSCLLAAKSAYEVFDVLVDKDSLRSRVDLASDVADVTGADEHATASRKTLGEDDREYVAHLGLPEVG